MTVQVGRCSQLANPMFRPATIGVPPFLPNSSTTLESAYLSLSMGELVAAAAARDRDTPRRMM